MTEAELELLAKDCAWSSHGVFPMRGEPRATPEQRVEGLYRLGWNDCMHSLARDEGIFRAWLQSLDESTLAALAPLLDAEKVWLRHRDGAVYLLLQDGDVDPEEVALEEVVQRYGGGNA